MPNPRPQDDDEVLEILELTYQECMDLVKSGAIEDAKNNHSPFNIMLCIFGG